MSRERGLEMSEQQKRERERESQLSFHKNILMTRQTFDCFAFEVVVDLPLQYKHLLFAFVFVFFCIGENKFTLMSIALILEIKLT